MSLWTVVLFVVTVSCTVNGDNFTIPHVRPPPGKRLFNSTAIDSVIRNFTQRMKDRNLATLFQNCFPNTLDTTVVKGSDADSFVITGDIPAMWLRDSTNQVLPYIPFVSQDAQLRGMIAGLVKRQLRSVLIDSYANAYNEVPNGNGHQTDTRVPPMQPALFEGKYEVDSLCAVLKLSFHFYNASGDASVINTTLYLNALDKILTTMENQTKSTEQQDGDYPYQFMRVNPWEFDVYPNNTVAFTGMIRSAFRPSDDETLYDFLVPSNVMAHVELTNTLKMLRSIGWSWALQPQVDALAKRIQRLLDTISFGLRYFATSVNVSSSDTTDVSAARFFYEVDGFGDVNEMDDPNIPSLLSLEFLGFEGFSGLSLDVVNNTRSWVLSAANPFYYCGAVGCGVGSPHTPPGYIWPMALIVRAFTSRSDSEILQQLQMLKRSAQYTGFMHESFDPNNVKQFTRPWFAWANTLFGQLIVHLARDKPHLIFRH